MRLFKPPGSPWVRGVLLVVLLAFSAPDFASELPSRQRAYGLLMMACNRGDDAAVQRVLALREQLNLDLNVPTANWSNTPLNAAASKGHLNIVAMLLDAGADPNARGALGELPLASAAAGGYASVVRRLLDGGARVDEMTGRGSRMTALTRASRYGHDRVVAVLIAAGADVNHLALGGATALVLSREYKHKRVEAMLLAAGAK
jgi:ankyrin repeat protein